MGCKLEKIIKNNQQLLKDAIKLHQNGNLHEADNLYTNYLFLEPNNPDALHLSGVLKAQLNQPIEGIEQIERAIVLRKRFPQALSNLAKIMCDLGNNKAGSLTGTLPHHH